MDYKSKSAYIILLLTFIFPLIIFNGAVDDFLPKHIAIISETTNKGYIQGYVEAPAFYAFGTIIQDVTGIKSTELLYLPIQLVPYIIVFFVLTYKLSDSLFFSSLLTFIDLISGSTGASRVNFFINGIGYILFFSAVLVILEMLKNTNYRKSNFTVLILILGTSLVFIAYDIFAMLISMLISIFIIFVLLNKTCKNSIFNKPQTDHLSSIKTFFNITFILTIVQLGLSDFVYKTMIPTLEVVSSRPEISGLDKFFRTYFSVKIEEAPISKMLLSVPSTITFISLIKYLLLVISIVSFIFYIYKKIKLSGIINVFDILCISFLGMTFLCSLIRLYLGGIIVSFLYLPGIVCTLWLYRFTKHFKYWAIFVIFLLIILVPSYSFIIFSNDLANKDVSKFSYIKTPLNWYVDNKGNFSAVSDELTKNFFILNTYEKSSISDINSSTNDSFQKYKIMPVDDATTITQITDSKISKKYFILNYKLNSMSLQNWIIIKPWNQFKGNIENNSKINKIYDVKYVGIYYS